jgi:DNA-binding NtrC family response regulator
LVLLPPDATLSTTPYPCPLPSAPCPAFKPFPLALRIVLAYHAPMLENMPRFSLLCVDDEERILSSLVRLFNADPYEIHTALSGEEALAILKRERVDATLIDLRMPGMDGLALLRQIRTSYPQIMSIMMTGDGGIREAVEAIQLGALDFLEKPFSPEGLRARMAQIRQIWQLQVENQRLREAAEFTFGFESLVGNSTAALRLKEMISRLAPSDAPVLIAGETGTGKELVARAIHHLSPRRDEAFVPVDCAGISETVVESELFGHVKGAFTGAHAATLGLIRSADRGTLFLDEVGELSPGMQAKLLRTIQEKEVRPVGSARSFAVDMRVVAATNRDLDQEVSKGRFREDLLYRLKVVALHVPPLRERKDDVALLARHFLMRFQNDVSPVTTISSQALSVMEQYPWPGNIRELENAIRRAVALGRSEQIEVFDLPEPIGTMPVEALPPVGPFNGTTLADYEKAAIQNALQRSGGNRRETARILEISEATIYRKMKSYGIK